MIEHIYEGKCPDYLQPDALDRKCPACQESAAGAAAQKMVEVMREQIEAILAKHRCGDGGCIFGRPGGMATNGGCRCSAWGNHHDAQGTAKTLRELARELRGLAAGKGGWR